MAYTLPRVPRNEAMPSDIGPLFGTKTASGTAAALAGSSTQLKAGVFVKALAGNAGIVYVGASGVTTGTGVELAAGESLFIETDDLAKVYVIDDGSGYTVRYIAS